MAGAGRAAVEVSLFGRVRIALAARGALCRGEAGGKRLEDRIESGHSIVGAADHQAVATVQAPHAAAGAAVEVLDAELLEFVGAPDVVAIIGVAAVHHHVAG